MRLRPDHRFQDVLAAVNASANVPTESRMAALFARLDNPSGVVDENVDYAYELHSEEEHRAIVDAFLLSKCEVAEISALLDIDAGVLETYAYLFMDMTVFRNRLEIISYAARYNSSEYGKEMVRTAVHVGADYLYWTYGKTRADFDPRYVIQKTMMDSFFRGMAHKGNALTTGVAKESHKWWGTAVKNAELMERLNPTTAKQAVEELRIALGQKDDTVSADNFEVPLDQILH